MTKAQSTRATLSGAVSSDYETFRIPPLMPKRTIRIADEGGESVGVYRAVCGAATVSRTSQV